MEKGVLKNFSIFTGKQKIFKNTYFEEHLRTAASVILEIIALAEKEF